MEAWFIRGLHGWYKENKRDLPWRKEKDPYKIWLSEIILQQTQVVQGLSYYYKFLKNYPTVKHLARATEDQVLKDWQGLGYYSRARNLHAAAKLIVKCGGVFPSDYDSIRKLKGVGDYTAAAISSFAFGLNHAVVDGNVYRLLSRVFGIETPIDSTQGKKEFKFLADKLLDKNNPGDYNQSIIEFGSQYCKPSKPDCVHCIFSEKCSAFKNNMTDQLPVKSKKTKIKKRFFNYFVVCDVNKNILVRKRVAGDIWQGLYEFPLIETDKETDALSLFSTREFKSIAGKKAKLILESKSYKHILSHQHLYTKFFVFESPVVFKKGACSKKNISSLPFPRLIEKFVNECKTSETAFFD